LVQGAARLAPSIHGAGWGNADLCRVIGGSLGARARLADGWTQVALMEHASIAAFARFTLQLLALGAPAHLVEGSNAAMIDETNHAKLAFGIASAYAGQDVGPGRLDLQNALGETSLGEILINVIREGCIGETVAAIEASEALEHAVDPVVREALARIAEDELRHAELAWKFVRWALLQGGNELRTVAEQEFERVRREVAANARSSAAVLAGNCTSGEQELLAGGIVSGELREELRAFALDQVVLPCATALFDRQMVAAA
jgi:hypothetical protein